MKRILFFLLATTALTGCYKDKSSDRYDPIGSISITGIESRYNVTSFIDVLTISPVVTSTDPGDKPADFDYLWTLFSNDLGSGSAVTFRPPDTLAHGKGAKDLSYAVTLSPGSYTVQLQALNTLNGYSVFATTTIIVNTEFSTGYYFLKETAEGNTELDFLSPSGNLAANLLEAKLGSPIIGPPTRLGYFTNYSYMDDETGSFVPCKALVPMGGRDCKVMKVEDMSLIYDHKTLFYGDEDRDEKPLMAFSETLFSRPYYVSNLGLYSSNQMPSMGTYGTGKFGLPIDPPGGLDLSPHNVVVSSGSGTMMFNFFDEREGNLIYYNYNYALQTLTSDNGFSPTGINRTLLFMGTNGWAVFQDKANPQERFIYRLSLTAVRNPITLVEAINPSLNFAKAQVYGSNKSGATGMLYAGVGDKLYMYNTAVHTNPDFTGDVETLLSPQGIESGEVITMITHKPAAPALYLMIATYKSGTYKVYMFTLSGGAPSGDPVIVASGQGKVVDIQYAYTGSSYSYIVNY